jgi:hypothetical protein
MSKIPPKSLYALLQGFSLLCSNHVVFLVNCKYNKNGRIRSGKVYYMLTVNQVKIRSFVRVRAIS